MKTHFAKFINMKKYMILITICFIMYSCNKRIENFKKYEWILNYESYDENYNPIKHQRVLFRNDSAISYSEILKEKFAFPLTITDSTISFKNHITIANWDKSNKRDTIFLDTLLYDFKNIMNFPILAIKSIKGDFITILTCSNENIIIKETNNFLDLVSFKISGYDIGDTINLDLLTNIEDCDDLDCEGIIEANLKSDENIKFQIINKKYIYKIEQSGIEEEAVENIIKVINEKLNKTPDTIKIDSYVLTEGFSWSTGEIDIYLKKSNWFQYYLDRAEEQKNDLAGEMMRNAYLKLSAEQVGKADEYELVYENIVKQTVLKYKFNRKTVSHIIE